MANLSAQMAGEIQTSLNRRALSARLTAAGIRAEVRESSQYEGGRSIRVYVEAHFTLERVRVGEYIARADAETIEEMNRAASRVSEALTAIGVRHRFEVYGEQPEMAYYMHHLWPRESPSI